MPAEMELEKKHAAKGGVVAGIVGGIAITLYLVILNLAQGQDISRLFKVAAYPFLGERALHAGIDIPAMVVGTLCHFGISIAWGVLFGLIFYGLSKAATVGSGILWGFVVWLGMFYFILPLVGAGNMVRSTPVWMAIVEHLVFGLFTAVGFLPYQRYKTAVPQMPRRHVEVRP